MLGKGEWDVLPCALSLACLVAFEHRSPTPIPRVYIIIR